MSIHHPNLKRTVAAAFALVMYSLPLSSQTADLTDEAALLEELKKADSTEAKRLDRQLQALWSKSGSPALDLLLKRGREALEQEDVDAAIEHLTALTDHAPEFAEGYHARASAYFAKELFGPAMADIERALALNPNNYDAIYGLGAMLETFDYPQRAYNAYVRALAINPHSEPVAAAVERLQGRIEGTSL
ncbi:MAG: tetratricopeptide repeat protein [Heliomarina sp.]|uniref:tetratricopeptide repeat protein n=1 Tax=Heliomarina sp. TaxID=2917556 RepID=UPI004058D78E